MTETVLINRVEKTAPYWTPAVGSETLDFLKRMGFSDSEGKRSSAGDQILERAISILQLCGDPKAEANNSTGMVLGYVQSGKTLSFTTLAALARDNDYKVVIVIAGTKTNLLNQSTGRLQKDLDLVERDPRNQKWVLKINPKRKTDLTDIENILSNWNDPSLINRRKSILVTVMKQGKHLKNLIDLFKSIDTKGVPTLIIDDEGDQASLNTKARNLAKQGVDADELTQDEMSTIYKRLIELKDVFSHHTFLQYTATPQAPLFISILDRLSPKFIRRILPGPEYTGGKIFFSQNSPYLINIPKPDIFEEGPIPPEPPESLRRAMMMFFLGIAWEEAVDRRAKVRSMLVHPSRLTEDHSTYKRWIASIQNSWVRALNSEGSEITRNELLEEFKIAYADLILTLDGPNPGFEELVKGGYLNTAIKCVQIREVNAKNGETPTINWTDSESWILVGGQSMDRGFTVEGLTVTYMPRGTSTGNVDTIQQRARFFGYKKSYLGLCRIFASEEVHDAFKRIVEHEEDFWNRLKDFDENTKTLSDWKREVELNEGLNLTRINVIGPELQRGKAGEKWNRTSKLGADIERNQKNMATLLHFLKMQGNRFSTDIGHTDRSEEQLHLVGDFGLKECLSGILGELRFDNWNDSMSYSAVCEFLEKFEATNPGEKCYIYFMGAGKNRMWSSRKRTVKDGKIQLFQGRNPKNPDIYPGDSAIRSKTGVTIQFHLIDAKNVDLKNVPAVAIWLPVKTSVIAHA